MKKCILLLSLLLTVGMQGQDAVTLLKFEEAEKAFNSGDYRAVIEKLAEVEAGIGVTSKTLYLKIMAQNQLLGAENKVFTDPSTTLDFTLLRSLLENTQTYINAMKEQGLDDRFREVHNIHEKLKAYPKTEAELKNIYTKPFVETIDKYYASIGGQEDIANVETMVVEENQENDFNSQYVENYSSTIITKKAIGKYSLSIEGPHGSKTVFNKEKGVYKGILFTSNFEHTKKLYDKLTSNSLSLVSVLPFNMDDVQSLKIRQGSFSGEEATIVNQQQEVNSTNYSVNYYFSNTSGRLIGTVTSLKGGVVTIIRFTDFREVKGLTFPFKRITKTYQLSEHGKEGYNYEEGLGDEKLALLMEQDNYMSSIINTTTRLKINEPIPESVFE
ncbi:hypothetical protein [Flagellimonas halotolerans]|uniref:Uncharacterized protein n=1 Tax=Flagellimonas halotolerans TaxID=3112164 RepID=A0ABU6IM21_9FLAO|nr:MULTISPECIES: hypothetical protein [unclassified Allomuricauda]MEC3964280.1 hypothetical protein [Muricauda sp. SYSU M86414]MEC4264150.1 hypothetical protein [Muricauda sp. SYSU M84420]